jgi:hypothetical protein
MREIHWQEKFNSTLEIADALFRAGNVNLDLTDKQLFPLIPFVGHELDLKLSCGWDSNDANGYLPEILHEWLLNGFVMDHFEPWAPSQLMAAYAAYLINNAEIVLDDLPEPNEVTYSYGLHWRRDQVIEHCACNVIAAMEACHFGKLLLDEKIESNPEKLAALIKAHDSKRAKSAVSNRSDQILKPGWLEHCKKVLDSGIAIKTLNDLLSVEGYDPAVTKITPLTLRTWAGSVGIEFKAGRPKK